MANPHQIYDLVAPDSIASNKSNKSSVFPSYGSASTVSIISTSSRTPKNGQEISNQNNSKRSQLNSSYVNAFFKQSTSITVEQLAQQIKLEENQRDLSNKRTIGAGAATSSLQIQNVNKNLDKNRYTTKFGNINCRCKKCLNIYGPMSMPLTHDHNKNSSNKPQATNKNKDQASTFKKFINCINQCCFCSSENDSQDLKVAQILVCQKCGEHFGEIFMA